jgi:hypothetical protein
MLAIVRPWTVIGPDLRHQIMDGPRKNRTERKLTQPKGGQSPTFNQEL